MTIGPLPRMRIFSRSSLRGTGDLLQEAVEEVQEVVRPGAGLGVVLHGAAGDVEQREALDRAVVEVDVAQLGGPEVGLPAHRLVGGDGLLPSGAEDREAVVLRGDLDAAGLEVLDRVVRAAMAERELEGLQPHRPAQQLVAEADPEGRAPADEAAQRLDDVVQRRRVAGAVGQEDRVGLAGQQLVGAGRAGMQLDARAALQEVAHDRALDAGVDGHDARAVVVGAEELRLARGDLARQVEADHRLLALDELARLALAHRAGEDAAAHGAAVAQVPHERARVHAGEAGHAAVGEPVQPPALGARRVLAVDRRAHDHPARVDGVGLHGLAADPVVADVRVGEDDDLAAVAGVGDRLLVARHRGVEDDLAGHRTAGRAGVAVEAAAVLEQHEPRAHLTSLCTALNSSVPAAPSSSNSAVSTVVIAAPALRARSSPTSRSRAAREETASAATSTCTPPAASAQAVCSTQMWASMPQTIAWSRPPRSKPSASQALNTVLGSGSTPSRCSATSGTVGPRPFGYCSVTRTGTPRTCAPRTSVAARRATSSKPSITGRKPSWTSTTTRAVRSRSRRLMRR